MNKSLKPFSLFPRASSIFIGLIVISYCSQARAQRGLDHPYEDYDSSPSSGVPGFFDTTTAGPQTLIFDFPTFNLDYGLTPRLTVGTNTLSLLSFAYAAGSLLNGQNLNLTFLSGKLRYRLYSFEGWSAAITGYLWGTKIKPSGSAQTLWYLPVATLNGAYSFNHGSAGISIAVASLVVESGQQNSIDFQREKNQASLYTIWWRQKLDRTVESEVLLSVCPPINSTSVSNSTRLDSQASCFEQKWISPVMRGSLSWRSSSSWLWSAGLVWLPFTEQMKIPFVGVNYVTPIFTNNEDSEDE